MSQLRIVIIVSPDESDIFFANYLIDNLNVVGVIVENQLEEPDTSPLLAKALRSLRTPHKFFAKVYDYAIGRNLRSRAIYNRREHRVDFGSAGKSIKVKGDCALRYSEGCKDINQPDNVQWLYDLQPDLIAVCGASILKEKVLALPRLGTLNLHGGLSQLYRGLFTTDWAIYNAEPECVGATVHYVSPGIDDGDIFYQGRPEISVGDTPNSLYMKVVQLGVQMMVRAIVDIEEGVAQPRTLEQKGDLYLERDYTSAKRRKTWSRLKGGVIESYLREKDQRDKRIIELIVNPYMGSRQMLKQGEQR